MELSNYIIYKMSKVVKTFSGVATNLSSNAYATNVNHNLSITPSNYFFTGDTVTVINPLTGNITLTQYQLLNGIIAVTSTTGGGNTLTLPSAASIVAAVNAVTPAKVGTTFRVKLALSSGSTVGSTLSYAPNAGTSVYANTSLSVGQSQTNVVQLVNVSAGSEAVTLY